MWMQKQLATQQLIIVDRYSAQSILWAKGGSPVVLIFN